MEFIYSIIMFILSSLCTCMGFYFGFKLGRTNNLPKIKRKTKQEKKRDEEEEKRFSEFMQSISNLDSYVGTAENQKEIV